MKILLVTTSFPVKEGASSGVFIERLAQRLGRKCYLTVLAPAADTPIYESNNKPYNLIVFGYAPIKWQILAHGGGGIPAALAAHPSTLLLLPFLLISMFVNCVRHVDKADIIFANWSVCGVIAGLVGQLYGRPVITTIRGEDGNRAQVSRVHNLLINLCFRLNKRVVTVSDDIAKSLSELFPAMTAKIVMIPNGVDSIVSLEKHEESTENEKIQLLMLGSLIVRKSVSTALHALSLLPLQFSLTIIGDGPERDNLHSLVTDLKLEGRVSFEGHVPPDEVSLWLAQADILLMTSKSEGRPNAVLEAFAAGVPVVGTDIPGLRELVIPNANGKLFPFGNYQELANCLLSLTDHAMRHHLGSGGRQFILENGLTWDNTADKYMQQFRQCCVKGIA
jgi:glycosyltransferase involved in cell wall biosynthesis